VMCLKIQVVVHSNQTMLHHVFLEYCFFSFLHQIASDVTHHSAIPYIKCFCSSKYMNSHELAQLVERQTEARDFNNFPRQSSEGHKFDSSRRHSYCLMNP
jgi:hypothetical protein